MKHWGQELLYFSECMRPRHFATIARTRSRLFSLLDSPFYRNLLEVSPRLRRQHLTSYLSRSFNARSRHLAAFHHYQAVRKLLTEDFIVGLLADGVPLWIHTVEADEFCIVATQNKLHPYEGDILLTLRQDGQRLFQVSFSIVPGKELNMDDDSVLLIGGAQGGRPEDEHLKHVVRTHSGVAPSHLVLAAVRGVAQALDISAIAGVSNAVQLVKTRRGHEPFSFDYDAFWPMFGGLASEDGIFALPVQPYEKSLLEVPRTHRRRTRKKRQFKGEVAASVRGSLLNFLRAPRQENDSFS